MAVPIYQTVAYEFDDAQHGADLFNLAVPGNIYTRIMNPTQAVLEQRVAELERGVGGLALSAGSAAVNYSIPQPRRSRRQRGDGARSSTAARTRCSRTCCRSSASTCAFRAKGDSPRRTLDKLIDANTKAVFCESIGNPAGNIVDIAAVADMARARGVATIVDNTVATPALLKPIDHGFDIVVHSMTKYMGGHGNSLGGMLGGFSGKFALGGTRRALPDVHHAGTELPRRGLRRGAWAPRRTSARARTVPLRNTGSAISPFNAFLVMQGIETLNLRMERHCENALAAVAQAPARITPRWNG